MSLNKDIRKGYKACGKALAAKVLKWTKRLEAEHARQLELLKNGLITKDAYQLWARSELLRSPLAKVMAKDLLDTISKADAAAVKQMADAIPAIYTETEASTLYKIDRITGMGASFKLHSAEAVTASMTQDLLPAINDAKNNAWNARRLNSAITQGIVRGESIPKIAKRIEGVAAANSKAAIRNARTAVNAAENAGRQAAYEEAAESGLQLTKIWLATMDDRTRDSHVEMDGEEVGIDEAFSNGLQYPCDPEGDPSEVWNCRCTMVTSVNGQRVDTSGRINKTGMSYEEWKNAHHR